MVDDILDFTQTAEQLGKPQGQDLASGNLTAPAIFALKASPELRELVDGEFQEEGSLERALALVDQVRSCWGCACVVLGHACPGCRCAAAASRAPGPPQQLPAPCTVLCAAAWRAGVLIRPHPASCSSPCLCSPPPAAVHPLSAAQAGGLEAARQLAREQGDLARAALERLPVCDATRSLELMVDYVLERIY